MGKWLKIILLGDGGRTAAGAAEIGLQPLDDLRRRDAQISTMPRRNRTPLGGICASYTTSTFGTLSTRSLPRQSLSSTMLRQPLRGTAVKAPERKRKRCESEAFPGTGGCCSSQKGTRSIGLGLTVMENLRGGRRNGGRTLWSLGSDLRCTQTLKMSEAAQRRRVHAMQVLQIRPMGEVTLHTHTEMEDGREKPRSNRDMNRQSRLRPQPPFSGVSRVPAEG